MKNYIFYHGSDLDGRCSGAIAYDILKRHKPELLTFAIDYGQEFPFNLIEPEDNVYMLDFSLQPFFEMKKLNNMCNLVWIDHHESSIREYEKDSDLYIKGSREIGKSACELSWEYFYSEVDMPTGVFLLGRYDVYDLIKDVKEFQYGMRVYDTLEPTSIIWDKILSENEDFIEFCIRTGEIILTYEGQQNSFYVDANAFPVEFEGYECLACNKGISNSSLFNSIEKDYDIYITFVYSKDKYWIISLFTEKEDINLSEIAKKYGGGGHSKAAVFTSKEFIF